MCTVSWILSRGGYELFMNRDELRRRGPAQGPQLCQHEGSAFLAPHDSDGGGSWIAVNASGLGLTLLNRYVDVSTLPPPAGWRSRGLLVTEPYQPITLTPKGARLAAKCRQRHEIVYRFLLALGIDEATAAIDAEGIEHHVSPATLKRFKSFADEQ